MDSKNYFHFDSLNWPIHPFRWALCACLFVLGSCSSGEDYKTSHPSQGAVLVAPDWKALSADATKPSTYILRIGNEEQTAIGTTSVFKSLFSPGEQEVLVYNRPTGISIAGTVATVDTKADGSLQELPGYLFSGASRFQVVADDTVRVTVPMKQLIHQLTLTLKIINGEAANIVGTTASISGIASTVNLFTNHLITTHGGNLTPVFTPTTLEETRAQGIPALIATVRLLGVLPAEKQMLTLNVILSNGRTETFNTDLTADLITLGTVQKPLELTATLELPTEAGVSGSITDWVVADNGTIDIH